MLLGNAEGTRRFALQKTCWPFGSFATGSKPSTRPRILMLMRSRKPSGRGRQGRLTRWRGRSSRGRVSAKGPGVSCWFSQVLYRYSIAFENLTQSFLSKSEARNFCIWQQDIILWQMEAPQKRIQVQWNTKIYWGLPSSPISVAPTPLWGILKIAGSHLSNENSLVVWVL